MRTLLFAALLAFPCLAADDDEAAKTLAEQKARAAAAWKAMELGDPATHDSPSFHLVASQARAGKLKAAAALLEQYRTTAAKALRLDLKNAHPGKITVYLLPDGVSMAAFFRRVEASKPDKSGGTFQAEDKKLHVAACPGPDGLSAEARAGEMVASLLLMRKAGVRVPVPEWLVRGFGRATTNRLSPRSRSVVADKRKVKALARKKGTMAVWDGSLDSDMQASMQASVAEYLAYVGGAARFPKLLASFKPTETLKTVPATTAMDSAGISPDLLDKRWKAWALR